ncbi:MAG: hypothetical protein IPM98_19295 [Lewinellaceae bacterium]|nr:hypothetical protein [Lewinellaceae bacterium]
MFAFVPANLTVQCNSVPAVGTAIASDGCGGAVIVAYNGQTRTNGSCFDAYTLIRKWTATDLSGNTKTATQRISVIDTQKPNFTNVPANITVQCSAIPAQASPVATDNCTLYPTVVYNGQTKTNGACANAYTLTRRWTASDNCGNTRSISQRITVVDNGKPVLNVPPNVTIACNATPPAVGTPTASDGCAGNVTIAYLGQSTVSGACPGSYQLRRTWRATDVCGNSTAATQTIQVQDTGTPAFFTSVPAPVTISCNQPLPPLLNPPPPTIAAVMCRSPFWVMWHRAVVAQTTTPSRAPGGQRICAEIPPRPHRSSPCRGIISGRRARKADNHKPRMLRQLKIQNSIL